MCRFKCYYCVTPACFNESQRLNLNVQNKQLLVQKHNELKLTIRSLILLSAMHRYSYVLGPLNNTGMGLQMCTVFVYVPF